MSGALAGCGGSTSDQAVETVTYTVTADADASAAEPVEVGDPAEGDPLPDEVALQLFSDIEFWADADLENLANLSEGVCGVYDTESDEQYATLLLIKEMTDSGMSGGDAGATLVYATGWKCPEHYGKSNLLD